VRIERIEIVYFEDLDKFRIRIQDEDVDANVILWTNVKPQVKVSSEKEFRTLQI
jgi:hypothetical protein